MRFYFPTIATGLGENGCRYFKQFVENIPAPKEERLYQKMAPLVQRQEYVKIDAILADFYAFTEAEKRYLISM
jgi:hypothetical protein